MLSPTSTKAICQPRDPAASPPATTGFKTRAKTASTAVGRARHVYAFRTLLAMTAFSAPGQRPAMLMATARSGNFVESTELRFKTRDGDIRWSIFSISGKVELTTGRVVQVIRFPQAFCHGPAAMGSGERVLQLAEHSVIFLISRP